MPNVTVSPVESVRVTEKVTFPPFHPQYSSYPVPSPNQNVIADRSLMSVEETALLYTG